MDAKRNTNKNERGRSGREKERERDSDCDAERERETTRDWSNLQATTREKKTKMRIVRNYKYIIIIIIIKRNP